MDHRWRFLDHDTVMAVVVMYLFAFGNGVKGNGLFVLREWVNYLLMYMSCKKIVKCMYLFSWHPQVLELF